MSITFVDLFCGAGGSSTGLVEAGWELKLAANHWSRAIETHAANHPDAEHLCADVSQYDMRRLPAADVLWASPICTELSPAGGRKRRRKAPPGQAVIDGFEVSEAGMERTRATFWDVLRATEVWRYQAVLCENVVEALDWELFDVWLAGMRRLGYTSQTVSVSSAHIGSPDNLAAPQWRDRIYLVFTRDGMRRPDVTPRPAATCDTCGPITAVQSWRNGRRAGKYRQQYDYRCPNTVCRNSIVEPHVRPAADIIDWSNLGMRIGDRDKPLAAATMERIHAGLAQFPGQASMVTLRQNSRPATVDGPVATVSAGGNHHGLVVPYRNGTAKPATAPFLTMATRDSAALVRPATTIEDCHFRMIQPSEQLAAQRFPTDYIVHGNKTEQTAQAGNAVSVNVAHWLGKQLSTVL